MSKIQFDVNIANVVVFDVAYDVHPVWWMEVYPFCLNQSKPLLHAKIKCSTYTHSCSSDTTVHLSV